MAKNGIKKTLNKLIVLTIAMFGFSFAMVPIYNTFCDITGLNGKVDISGQYDIASPTKIDENRTIIVEFDVSHNENMPWQFKPQQHMIKVHPGEIKHTAYFALNPSKRTMIAQAIPSITPGEAAQYFKKIQCFCFNRQTLKPNETQNLALRFYIDSKIPKHVKRLTLSYTLFDVTNQEAIPGGNHHG